MINDTALLLIIFNLTLIVISFVKIEQATIWRFVKPTLWVIIPIFLIQLFLHYDKSTKLVIIPSTSPILAGYVLISLESILFAVNISLRIIILALASCLFSLTTDSTDYIYSMKKLGLPYELAFMTGLVIYFLPMVVTETIAVRNALETRGASLTEGRLKNRLQTFKILVASILMNFLEKSKYQAIALDSRGFNTSKERTSLKEIRFKLKDIIMSLFLLALTAGIIYYFRDKITLFSGLIR
jgi:energy-coupling factor transporter transmembrane protein EcfT